MPTPIEQLSDWLAASSVDRTSPAGDTIPVGPYGELQTIGLDDALPDVPAGCLALLVMAKGYQATYTAPEDQPALADRAAHVLWLSTASREGFPACQVVQIADGQTMRQAAVAAGVDPEDEERLIVGMLDTTAARN